MTLCPVLAMPPTPIIITVDNINSILVSTYKRTPGTKVTVTCFVSESYSLVGDSVLTCQSNGLWDKPIPQCVSKKLASDSPVNTTVRPTAPSDLTLLPYIIGASLGGLVCLVLAIILCCAGYQWRQRDRKLAYLENRYMTQSPGTVMTSVRDYRYPDKTPRESWRSHPSASTVGSFDPVIMSRDRRVHIPRPSWFTMLPRQDEIGSSYIRSQHSEFI